MSDGERREVSFAFETSEDFRRKWRELDIATDAAEVLFNIAEERRDDDSATRRSTDHAILQHEMSDLIWAEILKGLDAHGRKLCDFNTWATGFAGRMIHLTVFEPMEAWQER